MTINEFNASGTLSSDACQFLDGVQHWFLSGQLDETQSKREFMINKVPFTIGRSSESSMHLPLACVSKHHAEILRAPSGGLLLRDLGSTNGSFVNGKQVSGEVEIFENDLIHFAALVFRVGVKQENENLGTHTISENVCDTALAMIQFERLISEGGLYPHFQPLVKLHDQSRIGYEVLGRSRLFGLQSPQEMFYAASQLNLEAQLSEAFRQRGVEIGTAFGPEANLFVNTHPTELDRPEFYQSLETLRKSAPNQRITLEIHEGSTTNLAMMRELCAVLADLNIQLAFDDFGVGRARLVELGEVRPDYLKFDMKLTKNLEHAPPKRQELVALFASLVNNLGIQTLAEGVETRECHDILVQMGFQLGQGFFYGRPSPISKYTNEEDKGRIAKADTDPNLAKEIDSDPQGPPTE